MSKYYIVNGTDNVVDIKRYRTYKECFRIFESYKKRLINMHKDDVENERSRIRKEVSNFPDHLLTKVKVQIFENVTKTKV